MSSKVRLYITQCSIPNQHTHKTHTEDKNHKELALSLSLSLSLSAGKNLTCTVPGAVPPSTVEGGGDFLYTGAPP